MPSYQYEALDSKGSAQKGVLSADSRQSAQAQLNQKGVYLTRLRLLHTKNQKKVSPKQKEILFRELSAFLRGGKTLDQALDLVCENIPFVSLKPVLAHLKEQVHQGDSLAQAMQTQAHCFTRYDCAMVRSGEEAGRLEQTLSLMAQYLEKQNLFRNEIRNAVAYPLFVGLFSFLTVLALFAFVIPTLENLYAELDQALPWITKCLLAASHFVRSALLLTGFILTAVLFGLRAESVRFKVKQVWDRLILRIPYFKEFIFAREAARFCSTLATLSGSGLRLLNAIKITQGLFKNHCYVRAFEQIQLQVQKGGALSKALKPFPFFPPLMISLIQTGEESGQLKKQLEYLGNHFEEESTRKLKTWVTFLEPMLIVGVGLIVGVVVLAVILPIVQLNEMIS